MPDATPQVPSAPAGSLLPLATQERNRSLDIIRGIAVFGLIWVNAQGGAAVAGPADRAASWTMAVFGAGKFWTLFSILFGVTLAMQLDRARSRGEPILAAYLPANRPARSARAAGRPLTRRRRPE